VDIGKEKRSRGDKDHRLSNVPSLFGMEYVYDKEKGVVTFIKFD